ncbi:FAD-dependent monooxygenase [Actinopolymorpha pittospori]
MRTTDVLVVGAGPTGLALACGLLSQGASVRVVDRAAGPATTSRANFLHARGSEVLNRLGALGTLPSEALKAMTITTYVGNRPVARLRFGDVGMRTAAPPMLISQARVEAALRARLARLGGQPEWATPLLDASQDADGVTAVLGDGQPVRARWLVGCDGTASTTRELSGIGFPGTRVSERFLLADVHLDWDLDRTGTTGWVHRDGMVGAMPMPMPEPGGPDDLWRILAYDPGEHDGKPTERQILDRVQEILSERTGHSTGPIRGATWASAFSVHRRLADSYRRGRMLLVGDAAHAHAPFGGQGMLTGLGDAENLAWKLALVVSGQARDSLLDTYQSERRPLAAKVLRGSTATTRVNIASGPVGRFLRDRMVVPLLNVSAIQRWATYSTSQLWVSYRRGPLADSGERGGLPSGWPGGRRGRRPRAGDRIADLACLRADGTPSRLHAEFGAHWALLIPAGAADACLATARRWLGERVTPLRRASGSPEVGGLDDTEPDDVGLDDVVLVRPDAHVAWRGEADSAGLERWLRNALVGEERPTR